MARPSAMSLLALALSASACTIAIDDYEQCEFVELPDEVAGVCDASVNLCLRDCNGQYMRGELSDEQYAECVRGCAVGECAYCLFQEPYLCAARNECTDLYDDFVCCSLSRCGSLDVDCPVCLSQGADFNACVDVSIDEGGACASVYARCFR